MNTPFFKVDGGSESGSGSGGKFNFKKLLKNKKFLIFMGVGAVIVIFLAMRSRNSQAPQQALLSGYPSLPTTGGGGGDDGLDQYDYGADLDALQSNFGDLMNKQSQYYQDQLNQMNRNSADQLALMNSQMGDLKAGFQNALLAQQASFDADLQKQYALQAQKMSSITQNAIDKYTTSGSINGTGSDITYSGNNVLNPNSQYASDLASRNQQIINYSNSSSSSSTPSGSVVSSSPSSTTYSSGTTVQNTTGSQQSRAASSGKSLDQVVKEDNAQKAKNDSAYEQRLKNAGYSQAEINKAMKK